MGALRVRVVSPEAVVWEGDASAVTAPAWDGRVGILPDHAPMIILLGQGELAVDHAGGGSDVFQVAGGVLKVEDDAVTVLTEYAGRTPPEVIPDGVVLHPEDVRSWTDDSTAADPLA